MFERLHYFFNGPFPTHQALFGAKTLGPWWLQLQQVFVRVNGCTNRHWTLKIGFVKLSFGFALRCAAEWIRPDTAPHAGEPNDLHQDRVDAAVAQRSSGLLDNTEMFEQMMNEERRGRPVIARDILGRSVVQATLDDYQLFDNDDSIEDDLDEGIAEEMEEAPQEFLPAELMADWMSSLSPEVRNLLAGEVNEMRRVVRAEYWPAEQEVIFRRYRWAIGEWGATPAHPITLSHAQEVLERLRRYEDGQRSNGLIPYAEYERPENLDRDAAPAAPSQRSWAARLMYTSGDPLSRMPAEMRQEMDIALVRLRQEAAPGTNEQVITQQMTDLLRNMPFDMQQEMEGELMELRRAAPPDMNADERRDFVQQMEAIRARYRVRAEEWLRDSMGRSFPAVAPGSTREAIDPLIFITDSMPPLRQFTGVQAATASDPSLSWVASLPMGMAQQLETEMREIRDSMPPLSQMSRERHDEFTTRMERVRDRYREIANQHRVALPSAVRAARVGAVEAAMAPLSTEEENLATLWQMVETNQLTRDQAIAAANEIREGAGEQLLRFSRPLRERLDSAMRAAHRGTGEAPLQPPPEAIEAMMQQELRELWRTPRTIEEITEANRREVEIRARYRTLYGETNQPVTVNLPPVSPDGTPQAIQMRPATEEDRARPVTRVSRERTPTEERIHAQLRAGGALAVIQEEMDREIAQLRSSFGESPTPEQLRQRAELELGIRLNHNRRSRAVTERLNTISAGLREAFDNGQTAYQRRNSGVFSPFPVEGWTPRIPEGWTISVRPGMKVWVYDPAAPELWGKTGSVSGWSIDSEGILHTITVSGLDRNLPQVSRAFHSSNISPEAKDETLELIDDDGCF